MFVPVLGFAARLRCRLNPGDGLLPLGANDSARLDAAFSDTGAYTRLTVGEPDDFEVVRVTGIVNGQVMIERAQENTRPLSAAPGTCAAFVWTPQNLTDFIVEGFGGRMGAICAVRAGSERITAELDGCSVTVDRPAARGATWRAGSNEYTQDASGEITTVPVSGLTDGTYPNATVTVRDGYVTAVLAGSNIVFSNCGCCCDRPVGGAGTANPANVISPAANWSLQQDGATVYIVGPPGELFSVETVAGVSVVANARIPEDGRAVTILKAKPSPVQQAIFIRSNGTFVGVGSVMF